MEYRFFIQVVEFENIFCSLETYGCSEPNDFGFQIKRVLKKATAAMSHSLDKRTDFNAQISYQLITKF